MSAQRISKEPSKRVEEGKEDSKNGYEKNEYEKFKEHFM